MQKLTLLFLGLSLSIGCATTEDTKCVETNVDLVAEKHPEPALVANPRGHQFELTSALTEKPVNPKVLHEDDHVKIALVTILASATMAEHATPVPVTVQTLSGEGQMTIAGEPNALVPGSIFYLDAGAPHALAASGEQPLVVLVHYIKGGKPMKHDH